MLGVASVIISLLDGAPRSREGWGKHTRRVPLKVPSMSIR